MLSAGFHEFGHAAAARYGGATPGAMGTGLYLVWPAFYTDVTDSYRLGRAGRVRTDLGGLYFNAIVAVAMFGVWWATGWDALLLVVATQVLQMVRQLLRWSASTATTCSPTSPASPTCSSGSSRSCSGSCRGTGKDPETQAAQALGPHRGHRVGAARRAAARSSAWS